MIFNDIIFSNARILTMDEDKPYAEAIHIIGNTIHGVGSNKEILANRKKETKIISVDGKTIMPGFIDSHIHIFPGSVSLEELNLMNAYTFDEVKNKILEYAENNKDKTFIEGKAVHYTIFKELGIPSRLQLDKIIKDKPLLLIAPDHHSGWANTKALKEAGILKGATLTEGNEVVMSGDGYADGMLKENEAIKLIYGLKPTNRSRLGLDTGLDPVPSATLDERKSDLSTLKKGIEHLASVGITSIHNMDGNFYTLSLLEELKNKNQLSCRVRVPFHFKPEMGKEMLNLAEKMKNSWNDDFLSSGFVKFFMDGVIGSGTAFFIDDYADTPGWKGKALFSDERFKDLVLDVDKRGLQIAVHAIGDGAVKRVIDSYNNARSLNGLRDARHRIEHIELIQIEDIDKLGELDIIASMQPVHTPGSDGLPLEPEISKIGKRRFNEAYAWRSIKDAGATVVFSTDWPVSNVNPLNCISNALNREKWTQDTKDQRLSLLETLSAYTKWGAYAEFKEEKKGMLKKGFLADLVILSDAIDKICVTQIGNLWVELTLLNGKIVFERNQIFGLSPS